MSKKMTGFDIMNKKRSLKSKLSKLTSGSDEWLKTKKELDDMIVNTFRKRLLKNKEVKSGDTP